MTTAVTVSASRNADSTAATAQNNKDNSFFDLTPSNILVKENNNISFKKKTPATININSASKAKLQTLPRVGAVTAEHIIAARPYNAIEELREVQGVTNAIFSEIQDRVSL